MSNDQDSSSETEPSVEKTQQPHWSGPDEYDAPSGEMRMSEADEPAFDDRDVRVPRDVTDEEAEPVVASQAEDLMDAAVKLAGAAAEEMTHVVEAEMTGTISSTEAMKEMAQIAESESMALGTISHVTSTSFDGISGVRVEETEDPGENAEEVTEFGAGFLAKDDEESAELATALDAEDAEAEAEREDEEDEILLAAEADNEQERTMNVEHAAAAAKTKPASVNVQAAHEAFIAALEAHATTLGLTFIPQSSFYQFLEPNTGHKMYVAKTARDSTEIHVETTMDLVGKIPGAVAPEKENGKIASVLPPKLDLLMQALNILASGTLGKVRGARRTLAKAEAAK